MEKIFKFPKITSSNLNKFNNKIYHFTLYIVTYFFASFLKDKHLGITDDRVSLHMF